MLRLRTIVAIVVISVGLVKLGEVIDPEGLLWFAALVIGMILASFTDPYRFGWTQK